ncbi:protein FAM166C-like [Vespula squamosa]|uniref:Protein FAM166C-like n=1 Tax=Vespula squamosa TaxID=30214 RepID=A0ABD2B716_VESSQ
MSNPLFTYYSPILKPCFMGPQLPSKQDLEGSDIRSYFKNYRNGTISRIIIPSYSWNGPKRSYTPRPSSIMTFRDRLRSLTFPQNNISTIDSKLMKEVDDLYIVVQAHRDQYKDHTSKLHALEFFKADKYKYQCASALMPSYLKKYPTSYTKYKLPSVLPLTYERKIETPCIPDLVLSGIYDRSNCIAYKR